MDNKYLEMENDLQNQHKWQQRIQNWNNSNQLAYLKHWDWKHDFTSFPHTLLFHVSFQK